MALVSFRTLDRPGIEFNVTVADEGVIARLVCDCGRVLAEEKVPDDPDVIAVDGGGALRERLLWNDHLVIACPSAKHNGRMIWGVR